MWAEQILAGNIRTISSAISAIENHDPRPEGLLN
jgi:hypothetical protein